VAPPRLPLLVTANQAGGQSQAHVGYPTPITAHALGGTAIRAIEMWLGDRRIARSTSTTDAPAFHARWDWTPREPGVAILVARAIDVDGRVAQSNLVRTSVSAEPPSMVDLREVIAAEGDSLAAIAARDGANPAAIRRWNDDLDLLAPLAAGTVVRVPVPIPPAPPPAETFDEMIELAADPAPDDAIVPSTSWDWTPPSALPDCQTYAWRVFPRRSDGTNGPASPIWTFAMWVGRCA